MYFRMASSSKPKMNMQYTTTVVAVIIMGSYKIIVSKFDCVWDYLIRFFRLYFICHRMPKNSIQNGKERERENYRLFWMPTLNSSTMWSSYTKSYPKIHKNKTQIYSPRKKKKTNSNEITNGHKQLNAYTVSICVNNWNGPHLKCTHDLSLESEKERKKKKCVAAKEREIVERKRTRCEGEKMNIQQKNKNSIQTHKKKDGTKVARK